ncbi:MAG: hypothetical protein KC443_23840 [Anaerolineales bacterium]|nr:hypothetical protein [Anaerolineales bacterium]MCB8965515.1 hypothetical protein [Ardenticatenaceae bacterium]
MSEMTVLAGQIHQAWLRFANLMSADFQSASLKAHEGIQKLQPKISKLKDAHYIKVDEQGVVSLIEALEGSTLLQKRERQLKKEFQEARDVVIDWQTLNGVIGDLKAKVRLAEMVRSADVNIRVYEPDNRAEEKKQALKTEYKGLIVSVPIADYKFLTEQVILRKLFELTALDVASGHLTVKRSQASFLLRAKLEGDGITHD